MAPTECRVLKGIPYTINQLLLFSQVSAEGPFRDSYFHRCTVGAYKLSLLLTESGEWYRPTGPHFQPTIYESKQRR